MGPFGTRWPELELFFVETASIRIFLRAESLGKIEKATTDRSSTMTGSDKAYSAPKLETLSLRATSDIDLGLGIHIPFPPLGS